MQAANGILVLVIIVAISGALDKTVDASKILLLHPIHSGSHVLTLRKLAESLISRGHQVDIIKWKDIQASLISDAYNSNMNMSLTTLAMDNSDGRFFVLSQEKEAAFTFPEELMWNTGLTTSAVLFNPVWRDMFPFLQAHCESLHRDYKLAKDLKAKQYDLVIVDLIWNECSIGYARQVLKVPIVVGFWGISPTTLQPDSRVSFPRSSHQPKSKLIADVHNPYLKRGIDLVMSLLNQIVMLVYQSYIHAAMQKFVPNSASPNELLQGLDGVLINTDRSFEVARLLPPNYIHTGGLQIEREPRNLVELPKDLADWMNNADKGVILFSLGATLDSKAAPKHIINSFLEAFGKISQRIIFHYKGNRNTLKIPPNMKLVNGWIPQQTVLAHPKTKLFVNHCGLQGVLEAAWNAVPIVCMPIVNDAEDTLLRAESNGIGLGLNKDNLTPEIVLKAVQEVINRRKYKDNAMKLSTQMRDTTESPLDRANNFLEYLIRHDGAEHLRLPKGKISFVEYFCLDVIAIVFLLIVMFIISLYSLLSRFILNKI